MILMFMDSVSNGYKPLRRFWVRVGSRTELLEWVLPSAKLGPVLLGWVPQENRALASPAFQRQLSIGVFIISRHDLYVKAAV